MKATHETARERRAVVTERDVEVIKEMHHEGFTQDVIARRFDISQMTVCRILRCDASVVIRPGGVA